MRTHRQIQKDDQTAREGFLAVLTAGGFPLPLREIRYEARRLGFTAPEGAYKRALWSLVDASVLKLHSNGLISRPPPADSGME